METGGVERGARGVDEGWMCEQKPKEKGKSWTTAKAGPRSIAGKETTGPGIASKSLRRLLSVPTRHLDAPEALYRRLEQALAWLLGTFGARTGGATPPLPPWHKGTPRGHRRPSSCTTLASTDWSICLPCSWGRCPQVPASSHL